MLLLKDKGRRAKKGSTEDTVHHFPAICEKTYDTEFLDEEHVFGFIFVTKKTEDPERLRLVRTQRLSGGRGGGRSSGGGHRRRW